MRKLPSINDTTRSLGISIMYPAPGVVERIGADWDWIWIDGQHGTLGYADIVNLVRACELIDRPAAVRVTWLDVVAISQALDTGCAAVIVPCVDSVEEAKAAISAAKFPPLGRRSYGGRRVMDRKGRSYAETANEETKLIVQLESPAAVERAEEIASMPGVDGLFLGPEDLLLRRGHDMKLPGSAELLEADVKRVGAACRRNQKLAITVAVSEAMLQLCDRAGYQMLVVAGDVPLLAMGSKGAASQAREVLKGATGSPGKRAADATPGGSSY